MNSIELLSPAGGLKALHAAVANGADAVYLGEKSFSARQNAENFDDTELKDAVRYAHQRGVQVYLAMNTLLNQKETSKFEKGVVKAVEAGVDALIIQDFGGAHIAKTVCSSLPIHASTQMSAHNEKDVVALLERGFSRVVLARELHEKEIAQIYKRTGASLEVFVHGALCVCVSGQCLMSSFIGGRSGNRGKCAQPCRQLYTAEGKTGYFLSPRDLCLLDEIQALYNAGVSSLKIEGRMKSAEYVASVTAMYRKYIDKPVRATSEDIKALEKIFVRGDGFTKAYFKGINTPDMMNYTVSNDGIGQRSDKEALKNAAASFREGVEHKKVPVWGNFELKKGKNAYLMLTDGKNSVYSYGAVAENAINAPITKETAFDRIGKMGQTPFLLRALECDIDEGMIIAASEMNALRRSCTEQLLEKRGEVTERELKEFKYAYNSKERQKYKIAASIMTFDQLEAAEAADAVYMPLSVFEKSDKKEKYSVQLPKVVYDVDKCIDRLKKSGAKRVLASTYGVAKAVIDAGFECIGDAGLNILNPVSANEYKNEGIGHVTISPEADCDEIRAVTLATDAVCEVIAYGRAQMMVTRACIVKGVRGKCDCERELVLRDKTGARFPVFADAGGHINSVFNSAVTFLADKREVLERLNTDYIRLGFTDENKKTVSEIISMYKGEAEARLPEKFTRGYFSKSGKNK